MGLYRIELTSFCSFLLINTTMNARSTLRIWIVLMALAMSGSSAFAQTYKALFPTKLTMAAGQVDPINTLTLMLAPNTAGGLTWTLPASNGSNGDILVTDGSGNLSWASPLALSIGGDVTGTPSATVVSKINGATLG